MSEKNGENEQEFETISFRLPKNIIKEAKEFVETKKTPYDNFSDFIRSAVVVLIRVERKVSHLNGEEYLDKRSKKMRMEGF